MTIKSGHKRVADLYCHDIITKARLFKYIEIFTSKNRKFLDKKIWYFFILLLKT